MRKILTGCQLTLIFVLLNGCTETTLTAADDLGLAGQKAALAMKQATVLPDEQRTGLDTARHFHHAFVAAQAGRPPGPDPTTQQIDDLETFLDAQTSFLDSLASAYGALAGLATFDAAGKFNTAFAGLVTDTNGLLKTVDPTSPGLPATATSVVQELGGDLLSLRQRQQVIDASRAMRKPLQSAIDLLGRPDVRETFISNVDIYVSENRKALLDLNRLHLFTVAPVVDRMGTVIGVKSVPDLDRRVTGDRALSSSLQQVADPRLALDKLKAGMTSNYDNALIALKQLPPLHDRLEAGQPVNLTELIAIVNQIKPIVQLAKGN